MPQAYQVTALLVQGANEAGITDRFGGPRQALVGHNAAHRGH
jgi:hypothetical protein